MLFFNCFSGKTGLIFNFFQKLSKLIMQTDLYSTFFTLDYLRQVYDRCSIKKRVPHRGWSILMLLKLYDGILIFTLQKSECRKKVSKINLYQE